jgi:hypothetical protein
VIAAYRIHDLLVRSEFRLSAPEVDGGVRPDVIVTRDGERGVGDDAPAGRLVAVELDPPFSFFIVESPEGFVVRYSRTCELAVSSDGATIGVTVDPRGGDPMAGVILSAGGLAFAAMRRRHALFHASGVALGDRAVIALGDPGTGKTTLAAELALAGATVLADDAIRVDLGVGGPSVFPGARTLRLRESSALCLEPYLTALGPPERDADGRLALRIGGDPPPRAALAAVLVTTPEDGREHIELAPLGRRDALVEAVRHIRIAGFVDGRYLVDHFSFSSALVEQVPFFRLHRPPHALAPAEVRERIEAALGV